MSERGDPDDQRDEWEARAKRAGGCRCFPDGAPGYCPGTDVCPLCNDEQSEGETA